MLLFRASRVLGPLLSALAFASYANPVFALLLDGTFFSRLTRAGLAASLVLLLLFHALVAAVGRAGEAARRRRHRRRRGGGLQLVELEGDDDSGRLSEGERTPTTERTPVLGDRRRHRSDDEELGGAATEAEAEAGTESIATAQRTMQRTLRSLMDTQQQTAEQLATLTGALAGMQQGPPPPTPPPPLSTPLLPHSGAAAARGSSRTGQPNSSSARRVTLSQGPAIPEQPLIELDSETEPLGLYGSLSL